LEFSSGKAKPCVVGRDEVDPWPGKPETTSSCDWTVVTPFRGMSAAYAVAVQENGKIVAAGGTGMYTGGGEDNNVALARYNPDGSADRTFGDGGRVATQLEPLQESHDLAIQDDGRIVVVGSPTYGGAGISSLARYNPDGTTDISFGENGWIDLPWIGRANGVVLEADGGIVVSGASRGYVDDHGDVAPERGGGLALARYAPDGTLDDGFGTNGGWVGTRFSAGQNAAYDLAVQSDGGIVVVGRAGDALLLARYEATSGTLDHSFGRGGFVKARFAAGPNVGFAVAIQDDDRIVVTGEAGGDMFLARFEPDGPPDAGFGRGGKTITDVTAGHDVGRGVAIQPDGRIIVAGGLRLRFLSSSHEFRSGRSVVLRYKRDGALDPSFGRGGLSVHVFGDGAGARYQTGIAYSVAIDSNGGAVAAGSVGHGWGGRFAVTRYLRSRSSSAVRSTEAKGGSPGRALVVGLHGQRLRSVPNLPDDAFDVALSPDGRTIAFARRDNGAPQVYRMRSDGTDLRRLTDDPHGAFGPAWSPDGGSIAYSGSSSRASVDIYTVSATGGEPTRLTRTDGVDELQPSWSPDGSRIAFATPVAHGANAWLPRQGIRTLDIRSGRVTRITDGADSMPAWSPDGDRIAFLRQPDPIMGGYRLKLMEADVDGTHARVVLPHYRINSHLHWSPDGTALSATAAGNAAPWSVYVINVETARARAVVSNAVGGDWLPGGRALLVRRHGRAARESGCARPPSGC
jgi:uncharacterized delta-60 repeat protein